MNGTLAGLFARTLDAIRYDCPRAWSEMLRESEHLDIALALDGEQFSVRGTGHDLRVERPSDKADIRIEASLDALRRVILGEQGLIDSIEHEEIFVAGDPNALVRLDRLTWLAVAGAARSDSAAPLLEELLEDAPKSQPTNRRRRKKQ